MTFVHPVDLYLEASRTYSLQPLERLITDVEANDIHKRNVILKHKNVTIVTRRDILLTYAGHPQDKQTRKIQPSLGCL